MGLSKNQETGFQPSYIPGDIGSPCLSGLDINSRPKAILEGAPRTQKDPVSLRSYLKPWVEGLEKPGPGSDWKGGIRPIPAPFLECGAV